MRLISTVWTKRLVTLVALLAVACVAGAQEAKLPAPKAAKKASSGKAAAAPKDATAAKAATSREAAPAKAASSEKKAVAKAGASTAKGKGKAKAKKDDDMPAVMPWNLRDSFKFTIGDMLVQYAVESGEWRLDIGGTNPLLSSVGFKIVFADGTTLKTGELGKGETPAGRETSTNDIGKNTIYRTEFPPRDGLVVGHSFEIYADRPCVLVHLNVRNASEKPVELAKVVPIVIEPGAMTPLAAGAAMTGHKYRFVGPCPVVDSSAPSMLSVLQVPSQKILMSFGSLAQSAGAISADFAQSGSSWSGEVACTFAPTIRLEPGQKVDVAAWMTLSVPEPAALHQYYGWVASKTPHQAVSQDAPLAWVTVEDGKGEEDLITAVEQWQSAKVAFALVPAAWEGRPGSLEGGAPGFSKDMGKMAKRIKGAGAKPGLTVDPLRIAGGQDAWSVKSSDGQQWLNLSNPDARKFCVERIKKVADEGYEFIVVGSSTIPDEVLKHFNQTRVGAQGLAYSALAEGLQGKPVYPAAAPQALKADEAAWNEAAQATGRMGYYGVPVAPARFVVNELAGVDEKVAKAMAQFPGPIELLGKPRPEVARALASVVSPNAARGIEANAPAQKTAAAAPEAADTTKVAKRDK